VSPLTPVVRILGPGLVAGSGIGVDIRLDLAGVAVRREEQRGSGRAKYIFISRPLLKLASDRCFSQEGVLIHAPTGLSHQVEVCLEVPVTPWISCIPYYQIRRIAGEHMVLGLSQVRAFTVNKGKGTRYYARRPLELVPYPTG
jgi:hypothetical protein